MMKYVKQMVVGCLLLSQVWCGAAENPFNVDCFLGWGGGSYRPGTWTPLEIGITSTLTEPFEGEVVVSVAQDSTHRMEIRQPFVLTPGLPVNMPLVTKIAFGAEQLNLRLVNAKGRTCFNQDISLWDFSNRNMALKPVKVEDLFIGVVGRFQQFGLTALTREVECVYRGNRVNRNNSGGIGKVVVETKLPRMVPWDWTGFAGLDLLVLYDPDWSRFRPEQITGVTEWVMQGGQLVIILGTNGLPANALTAQWPLRVGALKEHPVTSAWLTQWGLSGAADTTAVAYAVSDSQGGPAGLFAVDHMGFGRVGVLGLDPRALGEPQRAHSTSFWMHLLDRMLEGTDSNTGGTESQRLINRASLTAVVGHGTTLEPKRLQRVNERQNRGDSNQDFYSYAQGADQQSTGHILDYLYAIDQMRPLSIGWVVLLLVLLAVLLGPVDYLVLKRLDRLPLTWVTSSGWILVFTVGAYYGVQALRAGDMQLRTVSLIDAVQDQGPAWSTRVCGLFAPKSDEYQLDNMAPGQWWSGAAASGSRWNSYQARSARRTLYCRQINGSNWPYSLPINIWTMQTLTAESSRATVPIRARVVVQDDAMTVEVTNLGTSAISEGMVVLATGRGISVGRVAPGETRTFEGPFRPIRAWQQITKKATGNGGRSLDPADIFTMVGTQGRSQGIRDRLSQGAAVVCVRFENEPSPFTVKNKGACQYDHVQFARLVVFPQ